MGGMHKPVKIHITDPVVIQRVAKLQEERKNNYVQLTQLKLFSINGM